MTKPITRVTLFVPGTPRSRTAWRAGKLAGKPDVEWVANDGEFGKAFSFGTVAREVVAAIDTAPGALVLQFTVNLRDGRDTIVAAVERLRGAGALAVRVEQSKVGYDVARWLDLMESDDANAWHRACVAIVTSKASFQTCGMHAFSLPEVRMPIDGDLAAAQHFATILDLYQLVDNPVILSGDTFALASDEPRRVLERWPDTAYPPGHSCHNPYGVWRVGPPGGTARKRGDVIPVFIPTLAALLGAIENDKGKRLTKKQVETARDNGICMTMAPREIQVLERSRGYADLDPELAWEQWQLVRSATSSPRRSRRSPGRARKTSRRT